MKTKRVWKPLDVGGKRLYTVSTRWIILGIEYQLEDCFVLANSPSSAAELIHNIHRGTRSDGVLNCIGHPLDVLMPKSWWDEGIPCCKEASHE